MERIRYEVDPHNRLIAERTGEESGVSRFRQVLDGRFKIGIDNSLTYHIKKSQAIDIPQQIKFSGNFSLGQDHSLVFTLDKWNNQCEGNQLVIKGDIIDAKSNELSFSAVTRDASGFRQIYILKLSGLWQADEYNRLAFNVEREGGPVDRFTFEGAWEVNKQNQIVYNYTRTALKRKEKITKAITFKGYWDIAEKYRISYVLNKKLRSQFDFEIILGNAFKQMLVYEIGIGAIPERKIITLFGRWSLNERLGLLFEVKYAGAEIQAIIFGASCKLNKDCTITFNLKDGLNKDLGMEVQLSRRIFKSQTEAFTKALLSRKEVNILAGIGFRW